MLSHRFPFNQAVQRAVAGVTAAVRALDTRDALVVAATKQRLGGEVLAASEALAHIQKGLRDLQERLASVPSGTDGAGDKEGATAPSKTAKEAAQAVDKLSKVRACVCACVGGCRGGCRRLPTAYGRRDVDRLAPAHLGTRRSKRHQRCVQGCSRAPKWGLVARACVAAACEAARGE